MRILKWYREFVASQIHDLPKGSRSRGWTVFGLWSMLIIPIVFTGVALLLFYGWINFLIFLGIIIMIDIIFRIVDRLSN